MLAFKGAQFPRDVVLFAVFSYVRYTVSYRDLEEIMAERGVTVDHATLNRWVTKYAGLMADEARRRKRPTDRSWRMDETYVRVKGEWVYLYRAVDKFGKILDFMLSRRRNKKAATTFFARALERNGCLGRSSSIEAGPICVSVRCPRSDGGIECLLDVHH